MKQVQRKILLNPGPATTTDSVKYAQIVPDICPREAAFSEIVEEISVTLTSIVGDPHQYTTVLFGGSGTAAVESILSSVTGSQAILIIQNGSYGERMCQIAEAYGIPYTEWVSAPDAPIDLPALDTWLLDHAHTISHIAVVHHETTTGLLNDIKSIGRLGKKHGCPLIVDAMSSYAAIPIAMEDMNISYLAASSNKNVQGMAGVSFVIAHRSELESLKGISKRNYYLNLYEQYSYFATHQQFRFTPPVQTLYALQQAIQELKEEGVTRRYARYCKAWRVLINGITSLGLDYLIKEETNHSKLVTAILEPTNALYSFTSMHDYFYRHGFTIYPGKSKEHATFRIANIGAITYRDMEEFMKLLESYLLRIQYNNTPS